MNTIYFIIIGLMWSHASHLFGQESAMLLPYVHPEMQKMAFTIGEWHFDGQYPKPDGSFGSQAYRSRVNYTMGGKVFQDNFCQILADGKIDTLGITFRTYDAGAQKWRMVWLSSSLGFITQFEGDLVDGEFHFSGKGVQNGKPFIERVVFYDITDYSYSWKMDRSWDDGKTWIKNYFAYKATRMK